MTAEWQRRRVIVTRAVQTNTMKELIVAAALSVGAASAALAADMPAPPVQVPATYPYTPYPSLLLTTGPGSMSAATLPTPSVTR
jgi:hypothetical protein